MRALRSAAIALVAGCGGPAISTSSLQAPGGGEGADVTLAAEPGTGDLILAWVGDAGGERHLFVARSDAGGGRWTGPVRITTERDDVAPPHGEASPRLVLGGRGRVGIVWSREVPVPGRQWPASAMRFARSLDGGITWSPARTLNDDSTGAPGTHTFHGAAWAGDSGVVVAWLDERGGSGFAGHHHPLPDTSDEPTSEPDARIFVAASSDFGATWGPNQPVWGAVCPCCRVGLARTAKGRTVAAWRQHLPGNVRDVVSAPLTPAPMEPARVHRDDWEYPGCPHTGPALAVDPTGARHVAWYTGKPGGAGVYYARIEPGRDSAEAAVPLVTGARVQTAHVSIAALPDRGALVALDVDADGTRAIRLARVDVRGKLVSSGTVPGSGGGTYPQVVPAGTGAVVAWNARDGEESRIRLARVTLAGAPLTPGIASR